jgi:hypothetical protein
METVTMSYEELEWISGSRGASRSESLELTNPPPLGMIGYTDP